MYFHVEIKYYSAQFSVEKFIARAAYVQEYV